MALDHPKIHLTPDQPTITTRRLKSEVTLELVTQWTKGFPLCTRFYVQCLNFAETKLLHERLFQVVAYEEGYTTVERESGPHGSANFSTVIEPLSEWRSTPAGEAAEAEAKAAAKAAKAA